SIRGALSLIADDVVPQGTEEATELIDIAQKSTTRLIRLINDILDLRKIEAGKFELNLSEVNARDLVESSVASMTGFAMENDIELCTEIPDV
ncbi:histidine kinase dimerization/phospho-acceptor domain-containing protein, partial [Salmonella enterica]|uniref:histidine kinase dimerization/phospho-acceptor domain-containing protein n=1 Tax=Salmonella enterica TaxID=28901 RepID=UPI0032B33730